MDDFKEILKDAICQENIAFLEENKDKYSMNDRFEDENNDSLLLFALSDSGSNSYKFFLKNKANIDALNNEGENVIHSIVYSGRKERFQGILNKKNINHQSNDGSTPLLLSIALEKTEIAQYLIEKGADINIPDNGGSTPLHLACYFGNIIIVSELIMLGANLKVKTKKGNLPLALAVNGGHDEIVKFLYNKIYQ
ncbi:ankyrin repeat domain-containing protein [Aquiflexum sp. LQ15W]|uniref:ankyrin repeat domain-containing protein n=1 Tax=Cognataquiflexum nitidum TaxID=2922272 RepID=UPI001F13A705|nr:ankyrin repeat domain-containing protein [Cognataquiflexum nitidum]MCH6202169.1 ankyrin repeat domain-containing protein [Cognataquiflexum nitidum]